MKRVRIQTGGLFASAEPATIHTVLGSCIAACLFDPIAGVGGMNHFMLPGNCEGCTAPGRYGTHAMELLIKNILGLGGARHRLQAKVFGAAHVLNMADNGKLVPDANARFVREFLTNANIPVAGHQLGGTRPLEVTFHTQDGAARVRAFGWGANEVVLRERAYADSLQQQPPRSVIRMF